MRATVMHGAGDVRIETVPDAALEARELGATDVVGERGAEAVERIRELSDGLGVNAVLECVGTTVPAAPQLFYANVTVGGGPAPARAYIEELLPDEVPDGYRAMSDREAIKVLVQP